MGLDWLLVGLSRTLENLPKFCIPASRVEVIDVEDAVMNVVLSVESL